ncbi:hypothetical protein Tco_0208121, partial [Tanacetum coccineum]
MVKGGEDKESYASEFADSMLNDDVDDFGTRIEAGSHKEHSENINNDDEVIENEKKNDEIEEEKKDDDIEKMDEIEKEKKDDDVEKTMSSPRTNLSFNKTISEELTATVSPTTATTCKDSSTSKRKKRPISYKIKILPGSIAGMYRLRGQICSHIKNKFITYEFFMSKIREVLDHCNNVVPELTFTNTNEIINKEMPRLV